MKSFVILDRDGTIIVERHYLSDPDKVELLPGAAQGLRRMRGMGFGLLVVTNQSPIGRGMFGPDRLQLIHQRLLQLLRHEDVELDGIYFCPHTPEDKCTCRKPRLGMIQRAARELRFSPDCCFMVGDKLCDIEAGWRCGATPILVRTGYGVQVEASGQAVTCHIADDLVDAAMIIQGMPLPKRMRPAKPLQLNGRGPIRQTIHGMATP